MKTVLVLGANGFIGRNLCLKLSKDYSVLAYDRCFCDAFFHLNNIKLLERNFVQEREFERILQNVDTVYHFISTTLPQEETDNIPEEIESNLIPTVRLLEAMKNTGTKRIIFASSGGTIYGETGLKINRVDDKLSPICGYGVQKKVIESYLEFYKDKYKLDIKIARISNPYGVGQDTTRTQGVIPIFISRLLQGQPIIIYGDGKNLRDYLYMDDLIDALVKLGTYQGIQIIFNIASGHIHSLNEIVKEIENSIGKKFSCVTYCPARSFDVSSTILDIESTKKELSWMPNTSLYIGIQKIYKVLGEGE